MAIFHRVGMIERAGSVSGILMVIVICLGCAGPGAMRFAKESRIERLNRLLIFESHREQAVIVRNCALYHDPQIERLIEEVLAALISFESVGGIIPRAVLVKDTTLNAYSFPDGTIYIHTGLLARLEHEAELALLLSHEIVHIARQHALQVAVLEQKETGGSFDGRDLSDSLSWFHHTGPAPGNASLADTLTGLQRRLEQEADDAGLDMLIKANYDPYEALEIFEHLKAAPDIKENEVRAGRLFEILSSAASNSAGRPSGSHAFGKCLHPLLIAQAELEIQRGEWDTAQKFARRLVSEDPENARGDYLLGELHRQRAQPGDAHQALIHYDRAIAFDPFFPEPRKAVGLMFLKQGRVRQARDFFQSALDLSPLSRDNAYIRSYLNQCSTMIEGEDP